ncbi:hypothetical protein BU57_02585 [Escherichia coli O121:H19 str. 2011C-3609]|nr:hypothetical protein HMPREF9540_04176 [Escherichia coli MS 115-1]KDV56404.1 hypothetical protein BU57_02585 [Escherichia coli O121:H19 str. 2011C-3609]
MVIFYGGQIADKVRFVHAGCGVNALSGLQKHENSIYCRSCVGLISVAHQAVWRLSSEPTTSADVGGIQITSISATDG